MTALARFVLRHRRLVMVLWVAMFAIGGVLSGRVSERLTVDFSLPGQPGYETDQQIVKAYGNGGGNQPLIPVLTVPAGTTVEAQKAAIGDVFAAVQRENPKVRVVDYAATGDKLFVTKDGRSTYALVYPPPFLDFADRPDIPVKKSLDVQAAARGYDVKLTGYNLLAAGEGEAEEPSVLVETALGALGALVVLIFVFASFLALVPLIIAAVSIVTTFLVVLGVTYVGDVSFIVQFLIALIGLGVAIDYSLLLVNRWREERDHGRENSEAVVVAMETAGRAVVSSAGTVAISLIALLVIPVPFLRSMGVGGMLIPVVSTLVVLTLLPAILGGIGPRVDWPRIRHETAASRPWSAWARLVVRHRWLSAGTALLILGALILPLFSLQIGAARTESLARSGPAFQALQTLRDGGVPTGVVTPVEVLVRDGGDPDAVVTAARGVDGVAGAFAPDNAVWRKGEFSMVNVIPTQETVDSKGSKVAERIGEAVNDLPGVVGEAGAGPVVLDYIDAVYGTFPLVLALIVLVTFVLLARAFRSIVLPLKAVILNVLSVSATFGAMVLFWQLGYGSDEIFNVESTGAITFWLPMLVFAFLFGLSMDYEVFILARMREEYDRTGSTTDAVVEGIGRTGRLVTSAALILFLSFVALASAPGTDIKVFATALGFGILLDATIVRALLVPALVSLFGRWNWWLPTWAARVLRVESHDATPEPIAGPARPQPAPAGRSPGR